MVGGGSGVRLGGRGGLGGLGVGGVGWGMGWSVDSGMGL